MIPGERNFCTNRLSLAVKYPYTFATDYSQTMPWDFAATTQPDAVVIYLGLVLAALLGGGGGVRGTPSLISRWRRWKG